MVGSGTRPHWSDLLQDRGAAWSWILGPGLVLGLTTTTYAAREHRELYGSGRDLVVHASVAFLAYGAIAAVLWAGIFALRLAFRVVESRSMWWRALWATVACLAVSFFVRRQVLSRIDVLAVMGRWAYGLAVPASVAVILLIPRWMDRPLPWRPAHAGALLMCAAVFGQVTLQRTLWTDYLAPPLLVVAMVVFAGFGGALFSRRIVWNGRRRMHWVAMGLIGLAIVFVVVRPPGAQLRKAVLVYGGVERIVIRGLLWPVLVDRVLPAGSLWHKDTLAASVPFPGVPGRDVTVDGRTVHLGQYGRRPDMNAPMWRSMVWVLVDTLRADTAAAEVASSPALRNALTGFAWYPNYRSCSSSTRPYLAEMLGSRNGETGLLEELKAAGYQTARFGVFPDHSPPGYSVSVPQESDPAALARARAWLLEKGAAGKPAFVFVHLRGGHDPVRAKGPTAVRRYELAVASTLGFFPQFLASVPEDWIAVVSSDHGEAFGEHGLRGHSNSTYDELLRVPVLIRGHGGPHGMDHAVVGCPEILGRIRRALGGLPYVGDQASYQLASFSNRGRDGFVAERQAALTIGRHKAIWNLGAGTWQLYDLSSDGNERTDLSDSRPDVMAAFVRAFRFLHAARLIN